MKKRKFYLEDPGIIWIWWTPLRSQRKNIPNSLPRWWNLCHIHISPTFSGWNISNKNCFETTYTPAPMNRYWGPKMKVSNSSSNHHFSGTNYSSLDLLAPKKAPLFSHLCHHPQARSIEKKKTTAHFGSVYGTRPARKQGHGYALRERPAIVAIHLCHLWNQIHVGPKNLEMRNPPLPGCKTRGIVLPKLETGCGKVLGSRVWASQAEKTSVVIIITIHQKPAGKTWNRYMIWFFDREGWGGVFQNDRNIIAQNYI